MKSNLPKVFFTIPVMDEWSTLPACLKCIEEQSYPRIEVFICVNQPELSGGNIEIERIYYNNQKTLSWLKKQQKLAITVIDKSSVSMGWQGKQQGVGWARKVVMDAVAAKASPEDIILCMDADTHFSPTYCQSIVNSFFKHPSAAGMAIPYYHNLTKYDILNRAILRYEIYMRYFLLNLFRIHNPYCFTPIGSSMACRVITYKQVRGISPKLSGEDFYFLQKLRKHGSIIISNEDPTYPAARYSSRVFFGTGPALIKGKTHNWESYPIYEPNLFNNVKETYDAFSDLYANDKITPMTDFLQQTFGIDNFWQPIRDNFKTLALFRKSCVEKIDGLRVLQYVKANQPVDIGDEDILKNYIMNYFPIFFHAYPNEWESFSFKNSSIEFLSLIRNFFYNEEMQYRNKISCVDWY